MRNASAMQSWEATPMRRRRERDLAAGSTSFWRGLRELRQRLQSYLSLMRIGSALPIDVLIPVIEKDLATLPYSIDGVRRNIRHPILNFYVVAPDSQPIRDICARKGCTFVHERDLVDVDSRDLQVTAGGMDRSGWIYQQFLKWSGPTLEGTPYYLVVDADTVFVKPQVFERDGRIIFNYSDEHHEPYFAMYRRLLNEPASGPMSFVSHQMLFDRRILDELKGAIEGIHGCNWQQAILRNLDCTEPSAFSDYETYGHYVFLHHPRSMAVEYWFNLSVTRRALRNLRLLELQYGRKYKSISFHSYRA